MSLRIGIDFDDTLANLSGLLAREAQSRWELDLRALSDEGKTITDLFEGEERMRSLILEVLEGELTLEMEPQPGAIEVARRLAETHELVVVTARNEPESEVARHWLERHGIPVAGFIGTNRQPKSITAREHGLAVLLDDTARNFDDFAGHETLAALYVSGWWSGGLAPSDHVRSIEHWHRFEQMVVEVAGGEPVIRASANGGR